MNQIRSKRDLWEILVYVGELHLPSYEDVTMHFMKEILADRKRAFRVSDLKPQQVPRFSEFRTKDMYESAMGDPEASMYLPNSANGEVPVSRKFLFNVSNTHL